ncbi:lipid-A-disaccharide synthase [Phreatobacter sp.]|uniref:lipid-A-disaccharide synthase n=1 Tax=Phreatobacter sp. TaxID=1966341 RepID=UPI003F71066E
MTEAGKELDVFIVAGEESGDQLGAHLMDALVAMHEGGARFRGLGGSRMEARGVVPQFPMAEITLLGLTSIVAHLPRVLRRLRETVAAIAAAPPDVLVLIDSQGFNARVARSVRKLLPNLPIILYVSPSVWAWRPGRAQRLKGAVDHILALLPFEPEVHRKLGGPPCTYVGHPISERLVELRPGPAEIARRNASPPQVLVLPGSRKLEITRLSDLFGQVIARTEAAAGPFDWVLPAVVRHRRLIEREVSGWPVKPRMVTTDDEKFAAFRSARAALACSGTVTLELAVAGVPQVGAYRTGWLEAQIARRLITAETAILANLVIGRKVVPEFLQEFATVEGLTNALLAVIANGPARQVQLNGFAEIDAIMDFDGKSPSRKAAEIVLAVLAERRSRA